MEEDLLCGKGAPARQCLAGRRGHSFPNPHKHRSPSSGKKTIYTHKTEDLQGPGFLCQERLHRRWGVGTSVTDLTRSPSPLDLQLTCPGEAHRHTQGCSGHSPFHLFPEGWIPCPPRPRLWASGSDCRPLPGWNLVSQVSSDPRRSPQVPPTLTFPVLR